jgi:hypothetical protein
MTPTIKPPTVPLPSVQYLTSLKALWEIVKDEPENAPVRLWFLYRIDEVNKAELQARLGQKGIEYV